MQRWEYRVVSLQKGRYTEALNEYGSEGWELDQCGVGCPRCGAAGAEQRRQ